MGNGPSKQTDRKSDTGGRENNNETVIYLFFAGLATLKNDFFSLAKHNTEVSLLKDMTPMMMKDTIEIEPHPTGKFCHQNFVTNISSPIFTATILDGTKVTMISRLNLPKLIY